MLIYIVLIASIFALTPLKEQEYDFHLKNQHLFIVACREDSEQCEKVKNDFEDIWDDFNYKNVSNFPSKLFQISRTVVNKEFYDSLVEQTFDFVLVYVEHKNESIKKFLNPLISSSRKIKGWMSQIENQFADKIIDQKIEQLDKLINGTSKQVDQQEQVDQSQKKDEQKKQEQQQKTEQKQDVQDKNLKDLQQQLNVEEDQTQKRKLNVHDINVDILDKTEEKEVLTYFEKRLKEIQQKSDKQQKRIPDQSNKEQKTQKFDLQIYRQQKKNQQEQAKQRIEQMKSKSQNLQFKDMDLSLLTKEQIDALKIHFDELDKNRQQNLEIAKQDMKNGTLIKTQLLRPVQKLSPTKPLIVKIKNPEQDKSKQKEQILEEPKVENIQVRQSLYSMWIYFATFMIFMIFALKLVLFYKKKDLVRVKRYEDLEEQGIFVAEIQFNQFRYMYFVLFKLKITYYIMQQDFYRQSEKNEVEQISEEQFTQAQKVLKEFLENYNDDFIKKAIANLFKYYKNTIVQLKTALTQALQKIERNRQKEKKLMGQVYDIQQRLQDQQQKLVNKLAEKDQNNQKIQAELDVLRNQIEFNEEQIQQKNNNIEELHRLLEDKEQLQEFSTVGRNDQQKLQRQNNQLIEENQIYIQENKILQQRFEDQEKQLFQKTKYIKNYETEISHVKIQNEAFQKKIAELSALNIQYETQINELNRNNKKQSYIDQQQYQTPKKEQDIYEYYQDENYNYQNTQNIMKVENVFSSKRDNTKELIYGSSNKRKKNILSFPAHKTIEKNQDEITRLNNELDQLLLEKNKIQGQISRIPINLKRATEKKQKDDLEGRFEKIEEKILQTKNKLKKYKYQLQQINKFFENFVLLFGVFILNCCLNLYSKKIIYIPVSISESRNQYDFYIQKAIITFLFFKNSFNFLLRTQKFIPYPQLETQVFFQIIILSYSF